MVSRDPRMTMQTQMVLRQSLIEPGREWYGLEMVQATGLPTGTVYPIITRLEQAGWITSRWEEPTEHHDQARPRRRYYQLTEDGAERARLALAKAHQNRATTPVPWGSLHPHSPGAPSWPQPPPTPTTNYGKPSNTSQPSSLPSPTA